MEATDITQYDPKEDYGKGWRADFSHNQKYVLISPNGNETYDDGSHYFSQKWGKLRAYQGFRRCHRCGSDAVDDTVYMKTCKLCGYVWSPSPKEKGGQNGRS